MFKQHKQNANKHHKFSRCVSVLKLAELNSKRQNIRSIKSDRTLTRKQQLKINNDESIKFYCSIVVVMVIERAKTVL